MFFNIKNNLKIVKLSVILLCQILIFIKKKIRWFSILYMLKKYLFRSLTKRDNRNLIVLFVDVNKTKIKESWFDLFFDSSSTNTRNKIVIRWLNSIDNIETHWNKISHYLRKPILENVKRILLMYGEYLLSENLLKKLFTFIMFRYILLKDISRYIDRLMG